MKKFAFPENIEKHEYVVFPKEYEDDPEIAFHGTNQESFQKIIQSGVFKPAQELFSVGPDYPTSTSFVSKSPLALCYACKKSSQGNAGVVVMVKFEANHKVVKESGGCWYLYDHANSQPEIIGYCIVPEDYRHI